MTHRFLCRVYYEDTDAGGVVYYANYLKFAERARTEMLRDAGISQSQLIEEGGIGFVVRKVDMELIKPARLDNPLVILTKIMEMRGASMVMQQAIHHEDKLLSTVTVTIVAVSLDKMKPVKIPADVTQKLA